MDGQDFDDDGGRGKAERRADDEGGDGRLAEFVGDESDQRGRDEDLRSPEAEDEATHGRQALEGKLETDQKQKENNAPLGKFRRPSGLVIVNHESDGNRG